MFHFGKRRYLFTSSRRSDKGILATVLGALALAACIGVISAVMKAGGNANSHLGAVGLVSCLFGVAGLVVGIISLVEKDTYRFFPRFGFALSLLTILMWGGILYAGFILA